MVPPPTPTAPMKRKMLFAVPAKLLKDNKFRAQILKQIIHNPKWSRYEADLLDEWNELYKEFEFEDRCPSKHLKEFLAFFEMMWPRRMHRVGRFVMGYY